MREQFYKLEEVLAYKNKIEKKGTGEPICSVIFDYGGSIFKGINFTEELFPIEPKYTIFAPPISDYSYCSFEACSFKDFTLAEASFHHTSFEHCRFVNINFSSRARFADCTFDNCSFINCLHFENRLSLVDINKFKYCRFAGDNSSEILTRYRSISDKAEFLKSNIFNDKTGTIQYNYDLFQKYAPQYCPSEGSFIAWKVVRHSEHDTTESNYLLKLLIPSDAERVSGFLSEGKSRASKVITLSIIGEDGKSYDEVCNNYPYFSPHQLKRDDYRNTWYEVHKLTIAPQFSSDRAETCAEGIHFFLDKQEAMNFGDFKFKDEK